jgi:hypothetical protein
MGKYPDKADEIEESFFFGTWGYEFCKLYRHFAAIKIECTAGGCIMKPRLKFSL